MLTELHKRGWASEGDFGSLDGDFAMIVESPWLY